jgi:DNA-binding FadR family transcriptional regulator
MTRAKSISSDACRPKQVYEQVAERIRAGIRNGQFAAEERLPSEHELSTRFRVARLAVREAVGALQNQGLVVTRRNAGTYVSANARQSLTTVSAADVVDEDPDFSPASTLELRRILEPAIAMRAAQRAQPDALAEHYLAQMDSITDIASPEQCARWNESDRLFHHRLAAMTGDPLLLKVADVVAKSMDQPLWKRLKDDGIYEAKRIQLYASEHRMIYEAIVCGDVEAAVMYVEQHIKRVGRDLVPR